MAPGHIYFLCMALIVMPLLPFSRTAVVVGLAWLPGQFAYTLGADPALLDMCIALMACGAALGVAANDRDRAIGVLYLATAGIQMSLMFGATTPYDAWWLDWTFAMVRVLMLPLTVDWGEVKRVKEAFQRRREFDDLYFKRLICW